MINDVVLGKTIYILHLKKYWIQSLFYGEMGIEPKKGDPLTNILWGTAGQVVDI